MTAPQLRVEIAYASYDDHSKCYFYGIRVHRTQTNETSTVKRRRFKDFLQLHFELNPSQPLPSKYFSTSPDKRSPKLEQYLNHLVREDLRTAPANSPRIRNKALEKFLGLDNPAAFPPRAMKFEEWEVLNAPTEDEAKELLALRIVVVVLSAFSAHQVALRYLSTSFALVVLVLGGVVAVLLLAVQAYLSREAKKRAFVIQEKARTSGVKLEHKAVDDASISKVEADALPGLRERLLDFLTGTTPEYDEDFIKQHGETCVGLLGNGSKPDLQNKDYRKLVWDRNVMVDYRLVLFLRFNGLNVDKAESQARFAMTTHLALQMDTIHARFTPPKNVFDYAASPMLRDLAMLQDVDSMRQRRINDWWLRDREGCLCMFARLGHMPSGAVFEVGFNRDADLMNRVMMWFIEMFRQDMEFVHQESKGKIQAHCTVVADMAGFDLATQMGTSDVLTMVKKYVPLTAPCYGGILKRYIIINAPWYVNMLLSIVRPFIPKDILDSVRIYSGFDCDKMLRPFIEDKYIPKYLGGQLVGENGDEFCRNRIAPFGPFEPDKGVSLLRPA